MAKKRNIILIRITRFETLGADDWPTKKGSVHKTFIVWMFIISLYLPLISIQLLQGSIEKAVAYLERRLPYLTNPYAAAVTSYALATENKLDWGILFKFASPGFLMQHS